MDYSSLLDDYSNGEEKTSNQESSSIFTFIASVGGYLEDLLQTIDYNLSHECDNIAAADFFPDRMHNASLQQDLSEYLKQKSSSTTRIENETTTNEQLDVHAIDANQIDVMQQLIASQEEPSIEELTKAWLWIVALMTTDNQPIFTPLLKTVALALEQTNTAETILKYNELSTISTFMALIKLLEVAFHQNCLQDFTRTFLEQNITIPDAYFQEQYALLREKYNEDFEFIEE